jgi:hypothetical protein
MITEYFKNQIEKNVEMFFYGIEREEPFTVSIMRHKGSLDDFPTNLEFIRMLSEDWPLFKEIA